MKRILSLLLALLLIFGLTACMEQPGETMIVEILPQITDSVETLPLLTEPLDTEPADTEPIESEPVETEPIETEPIETEPEETEALLDPGGWYYSAEDVALYLHLYGKLPDNFITKIEAQELGWSGGSIQRLLHGAAIGGDRFSNREGLLPKARGRQYYECDIDTDGRNSRGAKRIVYSNDGLIYYTEDHYESFILLYGEE